MQFKDNQVTVVAAVVTLAIIGWCVLLTWAYKNGSQADFAGYIALTVVLLTIVGFNSITTLEANEGAEVLLFGTITKTHLSGTALESFIKPKRDQKTLFKCRKLGIRRGFGETDFVVALWPFYRIMKFPTTGNKVFLHAGKVFTDGSKGIHRVALEADPTFMVSFLTLRHFITRVETSRKDWKNLGMADLLTPCTIGEDEAHAYEGSRLAKILSEEIEELFLEALRKAASYFDWGGKNDIVKKKRELEMAVMFELGEKNSTTERAGIVKRPTKDGGAEFNDYKQCWDAGKTLADFVGDDVFSVDVNIEGINLSRVAENASEAEKAVNTPYIGRQEGLNLKEKVALEGEGKAKALQAIQKKMGTADPNVVLVMETIGKSGIQPIVIGGGLVDTVENLAKKLTP